MNLEELVGLHQFSGVDFTSEKTTASYGNRDATHFNFVLDGTTYCAVEDPSDGYRSMLDDITIPPYEIVNTFPPIQVFCAMRRTYQYHHVQIESILDAYDVKNGKIVFSIGTDHAEDYYPSFVATFTPEAMHVNDGR